LGELTGRDHWLRRDIKVMNWIQRGEKISRRRGRAADETKGGGNFLQPMKKGDRLRERKTCPHITSSRRPSLPGHLGDGNQQRGVIV